MKKKEQKLARVTSVLGFLNSAWKEYWWRKVGFTQADIVSRESQEIGKKVHKLIETRLIGNESFPVDGREAECAVIVVTWLREKQIKPLYLEQELKDTKIGLIGHCDLIAEIAGEQVIIDYKTSKKIDKSYALQLAAYAHMANKQLGTKITKGIILRVDKDPQAEIQLEVKEYTPLQPYWLVFKAGLAFYKFMNGK